MGMDAPMDISTDGLLTLLHWLSPAYPIGSYAYSHGLEAAITGGAVTTPDGLTAWISDILHYGAGQSDTLFIAAAYTGADNTAQIDAHYRAFAPCKERLMESTLQGAAFCDITRAVWGLALTDLCLPIAIGAAARAQDIPLSPPYWRGICTALYPTSPPSGCALSRWGKAMVIGLSRASTPFAPPLPRKMQMGIWKDWRQAAFYRILRPCGTKPNTQGCIEHDVMARKVPKLYTLLVLIFKGFPQVSGAMSKIN